MPLKAGFGIIIITFDDGGSEMKNPWESMPLGIYEEHMKLSSVRQLQTLNEIMRSQINDYEAESLAILGVAGGNGLEHINKKTVSKIYGIDICQDYLDECRKRHSDLGDMLVLRKLDISDLSSDIPSCELIIADLLVEYVGIRTFAKQMEKTMPEVVSCVIQKNMDVQFVSVSPYADSFSEISNLHRDIDKKELITAMEEAGFKLIVEKEFMLPNSKKFIRVDFKRQ